MNTTQTITIQTITIPRQAIRTRDLLQMILEEVRTLRDEVRFIIPEEGLEGYAHPARIKKALKNTLQEWKTGAITDTLS